MINSSASQAGTDAAQHTTITTETKDHLLTALNELKAAVAKLELDAESNASAQAYVTVMVNHIRDEAKPDTSYLKKTLASLHRVLEGAAGGAIGQAAYKAIEALLG